MHEGLRLVSDHCPDVVPRVQVQGVMAFAVMSSMFWALIWLLYRAYLVFQTPNDVLVEKLGLDIPPAPELTLEEISSRMIRIAWKHFDLHNSISKHIVQLNGVKLAETKRSETAATISNLLPGRIYHICIITVSAANFHTCSAVLRVRTKPLDPNDPGDDDNGNGGGSASSNNNNSNNNNNQSNDAEKEAVFEPIVTPYTRSATPSSSPAPAPALFRESSASHLSPKRGSGTRKSNQNSASVGADTSAFEDFQSTAVEDEEDTDLEGWSTRLKNIQTESDALKEQLRKEVQEHKALVADLVQRRDDLKKQVKERDEISGDLKRQVNRLEAQNRTVQIEKSKHERLLQQRESERVKRQEDIARWKEQMASMEEELSHLRNEKAKVESQADEKISDIRRKTREEQAEMKTLDEEVKSKGSKIKKMEEERRLLEGDDSEENKEFDRLEREREMNWEKKLSSLRAHYTSLIAVFTAAQTQYHEAQEHLKWVTSQRATPALPFPGVPAIDTISGVRARHAGALTNNPSPVMFPLADTGSVFNATPFTSSPSFPGSNYLSYTPGLNLQERSTIPLDRAEVDVTSHDPPLSPRADALLPSDLLGDEDHTEPVTEEPSMPFPTIPTLPLESLLPSSPSPVSSGSHPASRFASPRHSSSNLRESVTTSDINAAHPPVSETMDGTAESTSRRLSTFFGFHRQRGKTMVEGPPVLGSLDKNHSNSFPKTAEDLDPIGTRRRRQSHTGNWSNPMTGLFPRAQAAGVTPDTSSDHFPVTNTSSMSVNTPNRKTSMLSNFFPASRFFNKHEAGHKGSYNQFSPRHDPIDPSVLIRGESSPRCAGESASPRPSSTYSRENPFPQPGSDNTMFGWPSLEKPANRVSPLGANWSSPVAWSRSQSRRPSVHLSSANHLPLLPDAESDDIMQPPSQTVQAPIGTRPPSSRHNGNGPSTPKLNPAAPSFKTIFSKRLEKVRSKDSSESLRDHDENAADDDELPPSRRGSHSARSIQASIAESNESLGPTKSLTPSETSNRESFIQRLSRRSSSSKFSLSWKDRGSLFSRKESSTSSERLPQSELDEEGASDAIRKNSESAASVSKGGDGTRRGSSFFRRKSRKAEKATNEITDDEDVAAGNAV